MKDLSMRHLRYFDALARHGHFGRAAEDCTISQPALSTQIKDLEEILGSQLVERGGRQARLTPLGEEFAGRARAILRAVDELETVIRVQGQQALGRLRLGIIPTVAPYFLPDLMTALQGRYPGIELRPREAITQKLLDDLQEGRLDAAILALPVPDPGLVALPLIEEEFVLVRPAAEADHPVPNAEGLRTMRLLLLEEGHCFREQALAFCAPSMAAPRDLIEGSSLSTLVQMVSAGIGVTLVPDMAVPVETRSARVAIQRLASPGPTRRIGMVWRKSSPIASELQDVAALVGEIMRARTIASQPPTS
ncbi:MAG: LysR substrate-binding domain-containing protein [Beijerinckiaceae bacterium]|jgi:LysR family hydrogen peroxide-inducible transcriptional activator|nr:LysR substrate-binding domain-containing protein [Beijerinckiaceae bacterium]